MTNKKRYTLFLLSPRQKYINYPAHTYLAKMFGKRRFMVPLALPTVASLTPDHYDIHIYDEEIEEIPANIKPDIVGITTLAATSNRAFELGDHFRKMGAKVVYGGPYASFQTEIALQHGDAVVVGEAEEKWEALLADFEQDRLKPVYETNTYVEYKTQKPPRWDLVNMKRIFQVAIQVSRGCPFNCDFCLVTKNFGQRMRYREIPDVVTEIKAAPSTYFFFVDDNLTINKRYAKELMQAIQPLKISWGCMCSIDVAKDDELLKAMADAGCFNILIGFESLNPESLDASNKHHNRRGTIYEEAIARIHAHGIHINASFVVGFDNDDTDEFDRIFDFTLKHNLPNVNLHLLNAPPGSEIHKRYQQEGRLMNCDPELGVGHFPTIHYMKMSQIDLFDKYMQTVERLYSFDTVLKKAQNLFSSGTFNRRGGDISAWMKARLSWITVKEFLFTADPARRKLLFFMIKLIRTDKVAIDKGMGFLLTMLGYNLHILEHMRNMANYRAMISAQDQGAWSQVSESQDPESGINHPESGIRHPESAIRTVAVIGEGKMGTSIFYSLIDHPFTLRWVTSPEADVEKLRQGFEKRVRRSVRGGLMSQEAADSLLTRTIIASNLAIASDCDLVIEAVPEELALKQSLFSDLDKIVKPTGILASNSSSINPSNFFTGSGRDSRILGIHYFYPVPLRESVELIATSKTSPDVRKEVEYFLHITGKLILHLNESNSFILNRLFLELQNEAYHLVEQKKATAEQIDILVRERLFPIGLFDFMDSVGIDTMLVSVLNYTSGYLNRDHYAGLTSELQSMVANGDLGVKSGRGFYRYADGQRILSPPTPGLSDEATKEIAGFLRFVYLNTSKRFTMQSGCTIEEMNLAIREYLGMDKGPFE